AVGGAMDLAIGAKQVFVMMDLLTRQGESKLVAECSYPLTGLRCVSRVYTDVAVFDLGKDGARVREMVEGVTLEQLRELTGLPLQLLEET
ncbi:MAG: CoA-transferase, partial [Stenotrophomonas sp.]